MTQTRTSDSNPLGKQRKYRRLLFGVLLGGVAVALLLREVLGYPIVSEVVYWIAVLGFFGGLFGSSVTLFDERDKALEERASRWTLTILAPILAVTASVGRLLPQVSDYALPEAVWPVLYGFIGVYVLFAVVYGVLRVRS
jgi:H+/Cl- antiporter ClcA